MSKLPFLGLSSAEVASQNAAGHTNTVTDASSRSLRDIIVANVFTRFNAVLAFLFVVVITVGSLNDALFGLVVVLNALIGIIQEVRAKRTLDRLTLINAPKVTVIRDGITQTIPKEEVVLGDVMVIASGDQLVADGELLDGSGLEIDESLLTGESVPVSKQPQDVLYSGSHAVAGQGYMKVTQVGSHSYASRLAVEAKRFGLVKSELREGIDRILNLIFWGLAPLAGLLLMSQLQAGLDLHDAWIKTIAGLVGVIPQGLVLLTSMVFAVSVIRLGQRNVLVQELPAVEVLARVDVLCLDKTGTLTDGGLSVAGVEVVLPHADLEQALGALAEMDRSSNATAAALAQRYPNPDWTLSSPVPFSSSRKWSALTAHNITWVMGAPDILLEQESSIHQQATQWAKQGYRVLVVGLSKTPAVSKRTPLITPLALITLDESVRPDAKETLAYFKRQGVSLKVISGDHPQTVADVAMRAGVEMTAEPVDARTLPEDIDVIGEILKQHQVFGRVTPQQKQAMVTALQKQGHVVAMTGDGVNDVLALKRADLGIAMGSGVAATKAIARVVLLDGRFATLPGVVAEGRKLMANIERVATLFLTKTVYVTGLVAMTVALALPFPFLPRHLTLIGELAIGIPGFVLALEPNLTRYRKGFTQRLLRTVVPIGIVEAIMTFGGYWWMLQSGQPEADAFTVATLILIALSLYVLGQLIRPLNAIRIGLMVLLVGWLSVVMSVPFLRDFFAMTIPSLDTLAIPAGFALVGMVMLEGIWRLWIKPLPKETE
jgi:cation-transporting ATPase E